LVGAVRDAERFGLELDLDELFELVARVEEGLAVVFVRALPLALRRDPPAAFAAGFAAGFERVPDALVVDALRPLVLLLDLLDLGCGICLAPLRQRMRRGYRIPASFRHARGIAARVAYVRMTCVQFGRFPGTLPDGKRRPSRRKEAAGT
jgi:hypothetical protein